MKVAVGYALPIGPNATYHCIPVPHGYAVAEVDQVMSGFEQLTLDYTTGEGDLYELGEGKKTTIIWLKEYIVLPNWTPRSPARHPSPPLHQTSLPPGILLRYLHHVILLQRFNLLHRCISHLRRA
jgi:hypothetical protein